MWFVKSAGKVCLALVWISVNDTGLGARPGTLHAVPEAPLDEQPVQNKHIKRNYAICQVWRPVNTGGVNPDEPVDLVDLRSITVWPLHSNDLLPMGKTGITVLPLYLSMHQRILDIAADPLQYDREEVVWEKEGCLDSPNRRLFFEYLRPFLHTIKGKHVLDIGCGLGWLCNEVAQNGGQPLGIDPSARNVQAARAIYPEFNFIQSSLNDLAFAVMLLEHLLDLDSSFSQVAHVLKPQGRFIVITADFDRATHKARLFVQ